MIVNRHVAARIPPTEGPAMTVNRSDLDTSAAARVRRHVAGREDKSYVLQMGLAKGELSLDDDLDQWWEENWEYVWILKVRDARVGYAVVRPVFDVKIITVTGAQAEGINVTILRDLKQGHLVAWAPTASPAARALTQAGFNVDPARTGGNFYVR